MVRLGSVRSPQSIEVRFDTSRAGAVDVALYTTASVDAVVDAHPEVDWKQLRTVEKGRRSPLAALTGHLDPSLLSHPEAGCARSTGPAWPASHIQKDMTLINS
jgi:hypothetical protein